MPLVKEDDIGNCARELRRYDVSARNYRTSPVYWKTASQYVRRCSRKTLPSCWSTGLGTHRLPDSDICTSRCLTKNFRVPTSIDSWGVRSPVPAIRNPLSVLEYGADNFNIDDGEPQRIDQILYMVLIFHCYLS